MRYSFQNAEKLDKGIAILAEDLGIEIVCGEDADVEVTVEECDRRTVEVTLSGNS